jgi:uncharacterized protein YeaO (DUF488 family)
MLQIKRIYDTPAETDGYRVLVDRLWPRGVSKEEAALDLWLKEIAPSTGLRTWFDHDPAKFQEFTKQYRDELKQNPAVTALINAAKEHTVLTLLCGAKDTAINHAVVLQQFLKEQGTGTTPAH